MKPLSMTCTRALYMHRYGVRGSTFSNSPSGSIPRGGCPTGTPHHEQNTQQKFKWTEPPSSSKGGLSKIYATRNAVTLAEFDALEKWHEGRARSAVYMIYINRLALKTFGPTQNQKNVHTTSGAQRWVKGARRPKEALPRWEATTCPSPTGRWPNKRARTRAASNAVA
jgi:hypothetical protein